MRIDHNGFARPAPVASRTVRHARPAALDELEPLLEELRAIEGLVERNRGTFYRKGNAFLHFHEDPAGLFADLKRDGEWQRLPATTTDDRRALLRAVSPS
jgi:hypothetical protein